MKKVEDYIRRKNEWKEELLVLRKLLFESELIEDYKWGVPIYTLNKKNVVGIAAFKNYVGLWFFQGVFLKDERKLLINAQEDKTKGLRQLRFKSIKEIDLNILKEYLKEAIQNQKDGKEIKVVRTKKVIVPFELKQELNTDETLKKAFEKLSLGKQKEYAEYISNCKQEKTKQSRLEKITPMILSGVGLNDKYKNC